MHPDDMKKLGYQRIDVPGLGPGVGSGWVRQPRYWWRTADDARDVAKRCQERIEQIHAAFEARRAELADKVESGREIEMPEAGRAELARLAEIADQATRFAAEPWTADG